MAGVVGAVSMVITTVIMVATAPSSSTEVASSVSSTTETTPTTTTPQPELTYQPIPRTTIPRVVPTGPHAPVACSPNDRYACMPDLTVKSVQAALAAAGMTCVEGKNACTKGSRDDGVTVEPVGPGRGDGPINSVRVSANVVTRGQASHQRREDTLAHALQGAETAVRVLFTKDSEQLRQMLSVAQADIRQCGSTQVHGRKLNGYSVTCDPYTAIGLGSGSSKTVSHSAGVTIATDVFLVR